MKNKKKWNKLDEDLSKIRRKCICSHTLHFPSYAPDVQICDHCGKKVYRNEQAKFKFLLANKISNSKGRYNYVKDLPF